MTTTVEDDSFTAHLRGLDDILLAKDKYEQARPSEKKEILKEWGDNIARHLDLERQYPECSLHAGSRNIANKISDAIVAFFDAAQVALVTLPWPHTAEGRPNNAGLAGIVSILDAFAPSKQEAYVSPTMAYILNSRAWNPDGLWTALASTQTLARSQLDLTVEPWQKEPFWRWTAQLGLQTCLTDWKPNKTSHIDNVWYVTPFSLLPNPEAAVRVLAEKASWSFGAALAFYQSEEENISDAIVKTIFEMDYVQANVGLSTELLLSLMLECKRYDVYTVGIQVFQEKHPDLFAAFELHISLHDNFTDVQKYSSACEAAWMQVVHGKVADHFSLPDLGLESPQGL